MFKEIVNLDIFEQLEKNQAFLKKMLDSGIAVPVFSFWECNTGKCRLERDNTVILEDFVKDFGPNSRLRLRVYPAGELGDLAYMAIWADKVEIPRMQPPEREVICAFPVTGDNQRIFNQVFSEVYGHSLETSKGYRT